MVFDLRPPQGGTKDSISTMLQHATCSDVTGLHERGAWTKSLAKVCPKSSATLFLNVP